jgi:hypothetical protein
MSEDFKRPQFTLKSLLLSTSFVGAGIGCSLAGSRFLSDDDGQRLDWWRPVFAVVQVLAAGPLIGAGLLRPFGRARLGAYFGFFGPIIVGLVVGIFLVGWRAVLLGFV